VRAAAVHKEIYGAQRVFSAPGEKKDLRGTPSRDRDPQGMGSHTDWGCPEGQGAGGRGWACHVTGVRVSVPPGACHVLTVTGPRRRSLRGESLGEDQEISQGVLWSELRESCDWAPCARAWRRGGPIPPAPARGDCPLVPTSSAVEPTCVTSMTHLWRGERQIPLDVDLHGVGPQQVDPRGFDPHSLDRWDDALLHHGAGSPGRQSSQVTHAPIRQDPDV